MHQDLGEDVIGMYAPYAAHGLQRKRTELHNYVFCLPAYLSPLDIVGGGAYGAVAVAKDQRVPEEHQNHLVAIKKMANVFEHKFYSRRILRELKMLRLLKHPNIVDLHSIVLPASRTEFHDIYGVFEAMDSDLGAVLFKKNELTRQHRQFFIYQILSALNYIHAANVVHRDLKPKNILINKNCDLKIADFGLARTLAQAQNVNMTEYVASRWYRAPELLLENTHYTSAVDIWSIGCIFAQMILGKILLQGNSSKQQLQLIMRQLGNPTLEQISKKPQQLQKTLSKFLKHTNKPKLESRLKGRAEADEIDLLKKMLTFFPEDRISAAEALRHPFLSDIYQEEEEPNPTTIQPLEFQFESYDLKTEQFKDLLYEEILLYHFNDFRQKFVQKLQKKESVLIHILKNSNKDRFNPATDADDDE